jgi:ABC-type sugar transport system ATPase subunit
MARAVFSGLRRRFGEVAALDDFTLAVEDGELVAVLGPSGCGKSTVLRLIAGLETLDAGTIHLDDRRIDTLPPQDRDVAMVFQSYALYPHLTTAGNIEFPLRMRGVDRATRRREVDEVAALLELGEVLGRRPAELSGGQRQRVALARALVRRPALFLLDEPLSNLDARLRTSVRHYIRALQRRLGVTTLYVTHDQTEAMTLGDRVVVLARGCIQQAEAPLGLYQRPANTFVAGFVGTPPMNLLEAACAAGEVRVGDQRIRLPPAARQSLGAATRVVVGVRPEAFVSDEGRHPGGLVAVPEPATRELLGSETLVQARLGASTVTVRLFGTVPTLPARVAAPVGALHFFSVDDGGRLGGGE